MKPKGLFLLAITFVILAVGIWWILRPTVSTPEKNVQAPMLAKAVAQPVVVVEQPKLPAVTPKAETTGAADDTAASANDDPQTDLKSALPDFLRILKSGDIVAVMTTYMPPSQTAHMPPGALATIQANSQNPQWQQVMQDMITTVEFEQTETPTYSADGDTATYSNVPNPNSTLR